MTICSVIFKEKGKSYYFAKNDLDVEENDYVIVDTEKGEQFGKVISIENKVVDYELKPIIKVATTDDLEKYNDLKKETKEVIKMTKTYAKELDLNMQIVDATYTFDRKQLIINFISDERIDFRELVKKLAAKYKTRIDLHQIGVRDKAKEKGGLGTCGRCLCCSEFLNHIETITINMAKNQNIALNPNKINGSCGRLLCCLSYEDENYIESKKGLPQVGSVVNYDKQKGKVISVDILNKKYFIDIAGEIKEVIVDGKN